MRSSSWSSAAGTLAPFAALLLLLAIPAPANALSFTWKSAVNGSADDPTKWNFNGIPGASDDVGFNVTGSPYTVTFPSTVPQTLHHYYSAGTVTITMSSPHTTSGFLVGNSAGTIAVTMNQGSLNTGYLHLGQAGSATTLTLTNSGAFPPLTSYVHSTSTPNTFDGGGDVIGLDGTSLFDVFGGSQFYSDKTATNYQNLVFGAHATAVNTTNVAGRNGSTGGVSGLHTTSGGWMYVGQFGSATLNAYNGGFVDADGDVIVGAYQGAHGTIVTGPVSIGLGSSTFTARHNLLVGDNPYSGFQPSGSGTLQVSNRSWVNVLGTLAVGDPDGDGGSVLRVLQGGTVYAMGGLHVWAGPGSGSMDLQGGITHVRGGDFSWPVNKALFVNSQVGTPELWIAGGMTNTGPNLVSSTTSALYVGRSGSGKLRVVGAGTSLPVTGTVTVADSSTGVGEIDVDSTATMAINGTLNVGMRGQGKFYVMNGAHASVSGGLTTGAAGTGTVWVMNPGSRLDAVNTVWVGNTGGIGALDDVVVDSSSTLAMTTTTINPPAVVIYTNGRLTAQNGGVVATGTIYNNGQLVERGGGQIRDSSEVVNFAGASIQGYGPIAGGSVINSGAIAPYGPNSPFAAISIPNGSFTQNSTGHFQTVLGSTGGRRCDTLAVGGPATLGGALDIYLDPSFVRTQGDTFTVLTCTSRTGTFSTATWNYNAFTGQAEIVYTPTGVKLVMGSSTTGVPLVADSRALRFAAFGPLSRPGLALDLPQASRVQIRLYDVRGREVAALFDGSMDPGRHEVALPTGGELSSGAYFAKAVVRAGDRTVERTARVFLVH
ncbi:MAG: hypothetical protein E6K80_13095 [Candidatus Eisenbacteria bacterium]|uniref:T9SS type A sorting domain-containing protein n=1 Tax=Eiseniibacteriota bacterium TaxID=2212470 RepID=A0A538TZE4_UNCEI|nr:MAG: hypothetical protein E6K80_13095 [Candidatus Eisenbacteria bacterium]